MARRRRRIQIELHGRAATIAAAAFGVLLLGLLIGCVVYQTTGPAQPGNDLPQRTRAEPLAALDRIEGWVPSWSDEAAITREAVSAGFTDLLFFHGTVAESGTVKLEDPAGLEKGRAAAVLGAVRTWLTVTNHGKSLEAALIGDLDAHAAAVVTVFEQSRCQHLDLDYESLTTAQATALPALVRKLAAELRTGTRIALTLQPVDEVHRPEQREVVRELLSMREVYTVRFMMYDYHWRNSLPGALCPMPAYRRVLDTWAGQAHKLTMCLPLYGYNWPRPEDASLPRADTVTLREVPALLAGGMQSAWMREEGELAGRVEGARMAALPSHRAITARVEAALDYGVPAVSFWQLGCAKLAPVVSACRRGADVSEGEHPELASWETWIEPYKRRVCRVITGREGESLDAIAKREGIERGVMYRFNEQLTQPGNTGGQTVYVPRR